MSASTRKRPSNHHIAIRRFVPIRVINAVQQISTGLPSYLGLWSARWHPPGRRTVNRALVRLARHGHVAAHHARELAQERKAEPGAPERRALSESAWVKSRNSFACCWAASPMPVSATDGLVLRPPHAAQLSGEVSAMR
jgi:hypothetical protein